MPLHPYAAVRAGPVNHWIEVMSRQLDHMQLAIPRGREDVARAFYVATDGPLYVW
jgi:hypothetical protein